MVASGEPFQATLVLAVNPAPLTVRLNAGEPASAVCGEMLLMESPLVMVKVRGAGWGWALIVTDAVPGVATSDACTVAVSWVEETKVVARDAPFQMICVAAVKPVPLTVREKDGPPATVVLGERLVRVVADVMVKVRGAGWGCALMVTEAVPGVATREAGTVAASWLAETNVVVRGEPFQVTCDAAVKPVPLTVIVNAGLPAMVEFGDRLVRAMKGLMVRVTGGGDVCPVNTTVTAAVPTVSMKLAGTGAVSWLADTKLVVSGVPFQVICVAVVKPVPLTARVKAGLPTVTLCGEMLLIDSMVVMVKVNGGGDGCAVVLTCAVPAEAMRVAGTVAVN